MVSLPIMSSPKIATHSIGFGLKGTPVHRNHYSAPDGSGYHQHHHVYHLSHGEGYGHGHYEHGGGKKRNVALSALTLLAFLFFLNILQNCIQDQMEDMNPQVVVMTSRLQQLKEAQKREADMKSQEIDVSYDKSENVRNFEKVAKKTDGLLKPNASSDAAINIFTKNKNRY